MQRLTAYLTRLFATEALMLFGVVSFLLWLVSCLRAFDVVSVKGQGLLTLAWQSLLTMPPLVLAFMYVCVGIGMARALQALQDNHELHIVHTVRGVGALVRASAMVCVASVGFVLLFSNFVEPYAARQLSALSASVAADLVSSSLKPGRVTQVAPGVLLLIGGRSGDGELTDFFADDRRDPETRRTYLAEAATISRNSTGFVLELRNGSIQYTEGGNRFSEISFGRYDIGVERLTQPLAAADGYWARNSVSMISEALQTGVWAPEVIERLIARLTEGLRVVGICILVLAISGFPSGKRARIAVPMEAIVLVIAFIERGISSYSPLGPATGSGLMIAAGGVLLFVKLRTRHVSGSVGLAA